jgi:hypothetical protein
VGPPPAFLGWRFPASPEWQGPCAATIGCREALSRLFVGARTLVVGRLVIGLVILRRFSLSLVVLVVVLGLVGSGLVVLRRFSLV